MIKFYRYFPLALALFLVFNSGSAHAQEAAVPKKWAAQINFQQQDLLFQIDLGQLGVLHDVKLRPRYALDVQYFLKEKKRGRSFAYGQLSYFHNLYHDRWTGLQIGMGFEWEFGNRFFASFRGGGGIARVKSSDIRYTYEEGVWVETKNEDRANVDVLISPRLDVGYRISDKALPIDIFANSQLTINANNRVGAVPYYGLGLGLRIGF